MTVFANLHDSFCEVEREYQLLKERARKGLEEVGKGEQMPSRLGKRMIMFLAPKKMPTAAKKAVAADEVPAKKNQSTGKPEQKARKEYTGKVEGENFDD